MPVITPNVHHLALLLLLTEKNLLLVQHSPRVWGLVVRLLLSHDRWKRLLLMNLRRRLSTRLVVVHRRMVVLLLLLMKVLLRARLLLNNGLSVVALL